MLGKNNSRVVVPAGRVLSCSCHLGEQQFNCHGGSSTVAMAPIPAAAAGSALWQAAATSYVYSVAPG